MDRDITDILTDWEYNSENSVRIIQANDGRQVLQVRQPLGIEQYELDGRPDGKRPYGNESLLHYYEERFSQAHKLADSLEEFTLVSEDVVRLHDEAVIYYYRYLILFQIGNYERTINDTEHNLKICDLIEKHSPELKEKKEILQYKPYIIRINAISKAMVSLKKDLKNVAIKILESAVDIVQHLPEIDTPAFQFEKIRSLHSLRATLKQIRENNDSPIQLLKTRLKEAVELENYEEAAKLRDKIKEMEKQENLEKGS
jgi:tetratricopeptide (TPR) repeat protein